MNKKLRKTIFLLTGTAMMLSNTVLVPAANTAYNTDYEVEMQQEDNSVSEEEKFYQDIYDDVVQDDWFSMYTNEMFKSGIMTGMDAKHFGPYEILSRAQFVTILYRMLPEHTVSDVQSTENQGMEGMPDISDETVFGDVPNGEWYSNAVSWAAENNIVTGYENGNFGPADSITREQMAVMLHGYAKYKGYDVSASADLSVYPDADGVSDFAKDAVAWCVGTGIIRGNGNSLNPVGDTTRAECAAMVCRFGEVFKVGSEAGRFIVDYAKQFVGNPYIWGGNDLMNGIDSTHFVYQVLKNCGVYNEGYVTSEAWRTKGTPVASLAEAQAGDVICYSGHVAIYDGHGKIVEAKGSNWGITDDRFVDYKEILAIRRFV